MNDDVPRSAELDALLSQARRASPPRARLDAVRARLESELGPIDPGPAPSQAPPAAPEAPAHGAPSWIAPASLAAIVALGLLAFLATRSPAGPAPHDARAEPAPTLPATDGTPTPPEVAPPEPPSERDPGIGAPTPQRIDPGSPPPRRRSVAPEPTIGPSGTAPEETIEDSASSLREEVRLLERAMNRRREGDVAGARAALAEHARRFREGHLAPERERLSSELDAEASQP